VRICTTLRHRPRGDRDRQLSTATRRCSRHASKTECCGGSIRDRVLILRSTACNLRSTRRSRRP
jgi:hypothetical protein